MAKRRAIARIIIPRDTGFVAINIVNAKEVISMVIDDIIIYNYKNWTYYLDVKNLCVPYTNLY